MTVNEVAILLEELAPIHYAQSWDNVGLLVGSKDWRVHKVYIALDATEEVICHAIEEKADILITHHPLIFNSMNRIVENDYVGKRVMMLMEHHIAYYAMHTNYDVCRMGQLAEKKLALTQSVILEECIEGEQDKGIGRMGMLKESMNLQTLALIVKDAFHISNVKTFGEISTLLNIVAVLPGSGKDDIDLAVEKGADVFISGDIDHHSGIDAVEKGICVIDAGHYGIEHIFIEDIALYLKGHTGTLEICTEPKNEPFMVW